MLPTSNIVTEACTGLPNNSAKLVVYSTCEHTIALSHSILQHSELKFETTKGHVNTDKMKTKPQLRAGMRSQVFRKVRNQVLAFLLY